MSRVCIIGAAIGAALSRTRTNSMGLMVPVSASKTPPPPVIGCGFRFPVASSVMPECDSTDVAVIISTPDTVSWKTAARERSVGVPTLLSANGDTQEITDGDSHVPQDGTPG